MDDSQSIGRRADALAHDGKVREALQLLAAPEANAEADALLLLATWRVEGHFIRRDLPTARALYHRAVAAGSNAAVDPFIAFTAAGIGGPADWAQAMRMLESIARDDDDTHYECGLIAAMDLTPDGAPRSLPPVESLSDRPQVSVCRAFLTLAECAFLTDAATPMLRPSVVLDPGSGAQRPHPTRTSEGMAFPYVSQSPAILALNRRIAALTGTQVAQGEPLQVLRYSPGEQYKPHNDAIAGEANQRILTVLVTLSGDFEGGETAFTKTDLRFRGQPGDALIFRNVTDDGRSDPLAEHAGLPVDTGRKLIATRWIRARPFALPAPRPMFDT